jgi:hypothetical protein
MRGTDSVPITAAQVVNAIADFASKRPVAYIAYDASSSIGPAALRHAAATALPYDALKPAAIVAACMDLGEMLSSGRLAHRDPLLDHQLPQAAKRYVGSDGAWRWGIKASAGDIDAIVAMTYAAHAAAYVPLPVQLF